MLRTLGIVMVVLAAIDGVAHLAIDVIVQGRFDRLPFGPLFLLMFLGYLILIGIFLRTRSASIATQRAVDVVFAVYPAIALVAYYYLTHGRYNPLDLATIAKPTEALLIVVSLVHLAQLSRAGTSAGAGTAG